MIACAIGCRPPFRYTPPNAERPLRKKDMTAEEISQLIEAGLSDCKARVVSDDNTHFQALVVSPAFEGERPLKRHQMVYACLGERVGTDIHALSIRAFTPEEWSRES